MLFARSILQFVTYIYNSIRSLWTKKKPIIHDEGLMNPLKSFIPMYTTTIPDTTMTGSDLNMLRGSGHISYLIYSDFASSVTLTDHSNDSGCFADDEDSDGPPPLEDPFDDVD
ncbi:hypothetical protein B0H19DRAFT_1256317 [Mycena capillaripes]|nr:hypothetical protein B0H19DRAFT_1256317 [Mycena capillaripes]